MPNAKRIQSQWIGQYLAAAELTRRDYDVSFDEDTKSTVLHVESSEGTSFKVECKNTIKLGDSWLVKRRVKPSEDYFFIFVYGSKEEPYDTPQFWITSSEKVAELYDVYIKNNPGGNDLNIRPNNLEKPGGWEILPDYPKT